MAKRHKVELYMVDTNDDFEDIEDIIDYFENDRNAPKFHIINAESKDFIWEDDVCINRTNCTLEEYNIFFNGLDK